MRKPWAALVLLAGSSIVCGGPQPGPKDPSASEGADESLLVRSAGTQGNLVFPPAPDGGRRPRGAMPVELSSRGGDDAVRVVEPELASGGQFDVTGDRVRLVFNHPMQRPAAPAAPTLVKTEAKTEAKPGTKPAPVRPIPAAAGTIEITPAVAGEARWTDAHTLEFVSTRPFELGSTHTLSLGDVRTTAGEKLETPFKAEFVARASVAGKILGYVPMVGENRVIVVHPNDGTKVGRAPKMSVLFDQATEIGLARALITLEDDKGKSVPVLLDHPKGPTFEGIKVDPRFVVLVTPRTPLQTDRKYKLVAADRFHGEEHPPKAAELAVAAPLEQSTIDCGYGGGESCDFTKGMLRTSAREVNVVFNNPIETSGKLLEQRVQVSPRPKNLAIRSYGWEDGRVVLSGAFEPSTTYDVTIGAVKDVFGGKLATPFHFQIATMPTPASISMAEGVLTLDPATSKHFKIVSRNVSKGELSLWPVARDDKDAVELALKRARSHDLPDGDPPVRVPFEVKAERDRFVDTFVDLLDKLSADKTYLASVTIGKSAFGSDPVKYAKGSEASRPPVALITPGSANALAVHARTLPDATLVHVARLQTGEPVAGATLQLLVADAPAAVTTDANGVGLVPGAPDGLLSVKAGDAQLAIAIGSDGKAAKELFPTLATGAEASSSKLRGLILSDRGIYRPGSTVWIKANLRKPEGDKLVAAASTSARVRVLGPTGDEVFNEVATTSETGSIATKFDVPGDAKLGRHQIVVEEPEAAGDTLARTIVQIAEFEPPRFAVDVDAAATTESRIRATVRGRYLFGAPMDGGSVAWTLKREPAPLPAGGLVDAGLTFRPQPPDWFEERREEGWTRTGEATLAADGTFHLEQPFSMKGAFGPQQLTVEADVTDSSHRHVAGRGTVTMHSASRYAGLKVPDRWVAVGASVPVQLGVIDTEGKALAGVDVTARLTHVDYRYVQRRGAGGALHYEWSASRTPAGSCTVKSGSQPVTCNVSLPASGDYEITAESGGSRGGTLSVWAWREGDTSATPFPSRGHTIEVTTDKPRYAPGDKARLLVHNPYPAATAIVTTEQGGLLERQARKVDSAVAVFEVPITASHAPHLHATVTLVPIGGKGAAIADYRLGAVRIPVSFDGARLDVAVKSARPTYAPGEQAQIDIDVKDGGLPQPGAEIALAIVDEGVLRLTNFHAADPAQALRPGRALDFHIHDSRDGLATLLEQSHVAGDGGGEGQTLTSTRRDFVETALWKPDVRTDAQGHATVKFKLPDNLTQFRVMAVVLDDEGKGAAVESEFTVRKPVMLVPIVPRFAAAGDKFEVAAMLHNNTDQNLAASVTLGDRAASVTVPAGGHQRVGFPMAADRSGDIKLAFAVKDASGAPLDSVEAKIPVDIPGIDEHPRVEGTFSRRQEVKLEVPEEVRSREESVAIQVGQRLWPELGARLDYLLDYPHGCVEQTTSSTLPLIAAREILPRIGFTRLGDAEIKKRIMSGLERLATMRTQRGGLAYWPGGDEPNVYGTAYAMRAVVLAKRSGITPPRGLLEGMQSYLADQLLASSTPPEVQAAISQSLGELGELPASSADALFDTRSKQGVFGLASLAIGLSTLPGQQDRVEELLDSVEAGFEGSKLAPGPNLNDGWHYYGSPTRTRAEAVIALSRLRKKSKLLGPVLNQLAGEVESYTTQATAYSLLAVAQHLSATTGAGADVRVLLDGAPLTAVRDLGFGSREYKVPLAALRGKKATLVLDSPSDAAIGFMVSAAWRRPADQDRVLTATSARVGPDVYRVFTDAKGGPVDLARVHAGDVLRVAVLVRMPSGGFDRNRLGYVAVTDHLPAGFEPIQPDLATVASVPDLDEKHPFAGLLRYGESAASHVELHDDRVSMYFDKIWGDYVAASYLVRASTPGSYLAPPASAELMYEPNSHGYTDAARVVVE